mmetsp:Transcript_28434/g.40758  ORF Transcript_28434/g.40758 Transcript_28434/m.40758 type:complete len:126 (+) Transcript_28434:2159-2536(+)
MLPFIGLSAQQIGDESLLRNIDKMTAPAWTRSLYRYPPLAAQAWDSWFHGLTAEEQANAPPCYQKIGGGMHGPRIRSCGCAQLADFIEKSERRIVWEPSSIYICTAKHRILWMLENSATPISSNP